MFFLKSVLWHNIAVVSRYYISRKKQAKFYFVIIIIIFKKELYFIPEMFLVFISYSS